MTIEKISLSISKKVWGRAGIELKNPGSVAFGLATNCATGPDFSILIVGNFYFMKFRGKKVGVYLGVYGTPFIPPHITVV